MRILLVDDHEVVRRGVRSFLRTCAGFEVCGEAANGEEAVEKARTLRPDVVVMDITMPRMNGLEATREIRKILPETEVLILSQHDSTEMIRQALSAGAKAYVDKAALTRDLGAALDKIKGVSAAERQRLEAAKEASELRFREMIDSLPAAIYTTDAHGRLTHFNQAAVEFSGRVPEVGTDQWCVSWKLFWPDGTPLAHEDCPMAILLREGRLAENVECIAERPDGTRRWFVPYPRLLRDSDGRVLGGMNMLVDVTARKQAEEATNLMAAIVDSSDDAIVSKNLDGVITSWNHSAERLFGYSAEEAIGRHITLIVPPERYAEESAILKQLKRGERVDHFETVRVRKDGVQIDVSLTISPVKNSSGRVVGASKVARDITERKRIAESLRQSEERFRAMVETTPECVKLVAPDGTLLHMNSSGLRMVGAQSAEEVIGKSIFEMIAPEDRKKFQEFNERVCAGEKSALEFELVGLDGKRRQMETHGAPFCNSDGRRVQLAVTRDISERKQAEELVRKHRERFDLMAEATQVGFWFCDLPFDKLIWDARVKEHFWLAPDADVTIQTFYDRLHPDDRERTRQQVDESLANGTTYEIEYRTVAPDGREKWIRAIGRAFYDAAGRPKSFDGLTIDVTEQRRAQERESQITAEALAATAKFRAVFEQTTVFAGIMTNDGVLVEANKLCLNACGYRSEEVLGRLYWETPWWRNHAESREKIRAAAALAVEGIPYRETLYYSWGDGTERVVDFALHPITDDAGKILLLHPTGVDITDLKRAEENYRQLAETLEAEVRVRTSELEDRNLAVLRQSEEVRELAWRLLRAQDDERKRIARELHDSAGQLLAALQLDLTLLQKEQPELTASGAKHLAGALNLVQLANKEIRTMSYLLHPPLLEEMGLAGALEWYVQGLIERSGIEIQLDVLDDVGRLGFEVELVIFRIVQECLTNVHRHSGSKSAAICLSRSDGNVTVEVSDAGKGMSAEKLASLRQASGLGLRGMRERVRQFEGTLDIESNGSGTTVTVTLPAPVEKGGQGKPDAAELPPSECKPAMPAA